MIELVQSPALRLERINKRRVIKQRRMHYFDRYLKLRIFLVHAAVNDAISARSQL